MTLRLPQGKLQEALDTLLEMEKRHRLAEDYGATSACCAAILDATHAAGDWKLLNENLLILAKRRSQLRQAGRTPAAAAALWLPRGTPAWTSPMGTVSLAVTAHAAQAKQAMEQSLHS